MLYVIYTECVTELLEQGLSTCCNKIDMARLQLLQNQGRLLTAGLTPAVDSCDPSIAGFHGYTIIAEFDDLETAQAWVEHNVATGCIYATVIVKPYKKIF
ncbi:YciI family protein [Candidatus Palibaumannia cicadellinicola]|uniref:YciL protein n=1 Tax=Candidatus Palibaumannia cicadellinicola TaxID=186490 RepID=A0A088NAS4_9GAMM|nr:YciI family protein [Candidatus Baumannia cicadellinicola]AIN47223.1 YciL protein [Candidatus Baumannia cicadellinicola]